MAGALVSSTIRQALPSLFTEALAEAHSYARAVPPVFVLVGHSVFSATLAPDAKPFFLLHYWLTFLGGFAGGPLSALLIMDPGKAPISLLSSNRTAFIWTLIWWLMTYSPLAAMLNAIFNVKPVKMICKACVAYNRASLVMSRVLLAASLYPGIYMAPILIGTISVCGGKASHDALRHVYGLALGPSEFTVPTYSFRSAFLGACMFYLACVCPFTSFLTPEEGAGGLFTLFVAQSLLTDIGFKLDWSELLMGLLLRLANIPWPVGVPVPSKPSAPASNTIKSATRSKASAAGSLPAADKTDTDNLSYAANHQQQPIRMEAQCAAPTSSAHVPAAIQEDAEGVQEEAAEGAGQQADAAGAKQHRSRKKKAAGSQDHGWQVVGAAKQRKPAAAVAAVGGKKVQ